MNGLILLKKLTRAGMVMTTALLFTPAYAASPQLLPAQVKPGLAYQYVAETLVVASRQGVVKVGGINWQCAAARCTTSGPWAKPGVSACQALAKVVGRIKVYGHATQKLNTADLSQCNSGVGASIRPVMPQKAQAKPQFVAPGTTTPRTSGTNRPGISGVNTLRPGAAATASAHGGLGAPRASQQVTQRANATSTAKIMSIGRIGDYSTNNTGVPYESCVLRDVLVTGYNFGAVSNGNRLMALSMETKTPLYAFNNITSWSDGRIVARLPGTREIPPGQFYVLAIVDKSGKALTNTNQIMKVCPLEVKVSGDIHITNCGAGPNNVRVNAYQGNNIVRTVAAQSVTGNDLALRYEMTLPSSTAMLGIELRPALYGITCTGGNWVQDRVAVRFDFDHRNATQPLDFRVGTRTLRMPMANVSNLMRNAFAGTAIHINNYDPVTQRAKANDSFVRLSKALGGAEYGFNIPPVENGPRKYYINDINLQSITVRPQGSELKVTATFESDGMEFRGTCGQDGDNVECAAGAPDVQANISVDIYFNLVRYFSHAVPITLSYSSVRVVPQVDAQADGLCLALDFLCSAVNDYRSQIRNVIQSSFMSLLDTTTVRDDVGRALAPTLRDLNVGTLTSVRIDGSDLVLTYLTDLAAR